MGPIFGAVPVFLSIGPPLLRDTDGDRPDLSGREEVVDQGRFRIHFTRIGADAPPPTDSDGNGLPDLVDVVGKALPTAEAAFLDEGWRPLIDDGGVGGSAAIDVYVRDLPVFGYATPVPTRSGNGASCFLELDRGLTLPGQVAASVATHELHHCVEFRYRADGAAWLYEAAATYEQYSHVVDPLLDYAATVLYIERLRAPERRLAAVDGRFEYAAFLWMKYWSEQGGFAPQRLPALWDTFARAPDWEAALDEEGRQRFGTDLGGTFLEFATWNAFACANDVGEHYRADPIPCLAEGGTVPVATWDGAEVGLRHDEGPFTAAYLALPTVAEQTAVVCEGQPGLRVGAVALDRDGRPMGDALDENGRLQLSTADGGELRVIVAGTGDALDATCVEVPPTRGGLLSSTSSGCATAPGAPAAWWIFVAATAVRRRPRS